ncbi:MAG TPA: glycosyltransferase family 1 protein [Gemmatimonadaceae bacterium]|nr:glycosyltransferase family 1 protein [Gemmatimonadaceae bacterium]
MTQPQAPVTLRHTTTALAAIVFVMTTVPAPHIAVDARVTPERWGGVAHFVRSLVEGLGHLGDGSERFSVVVADDAQRAWIEPHIGERQTLVDARVIPRAGAAPAGPSAPRGVRALLRDAVRGVGRRVFENGDPPDAPRAEVSDGLFESLRCDVLHLPTQRFVVCATPTVYNPHDLQHLHYPQFFSAAEIERREAVYRTGCQLARCVGVGSKWVFDDVVSSYAVDPRRVQVIPEGAPTQFAAAPDAAAQRAVREKLGLPESFILYPAVAWPHKNHIRLFEALRALRDGGLTIPLVCTGAPFAPFWPAVQSSLASLELGSQVQFLGFLPEHELTAVFGLARALVLPSLFEASSLPIFEAWRAGLAVASTNATALPEQVVDGALLFDPLDVASIADAVQRIWTDAELRTALIGRGAARLRAFDWRQTARGYRAVYRRIAGVRLTDEDRWLLSWTSMADAGSAPPPSVREHRA